MVRGVNIGPQLRELKIGMGVTENLYHKLLLMFFVEKSILTAIVMNLLLWGCETWALLSEDRNRLNVCFNKWVRAMTGTRWSDF